MAHTEARDAAKSLLDATGVQPTRRVGKREERAGEDAHRRNPHSWKAGESRRVGGVKILNAEIWIHINIDLRRPKMLRNVRGIYDVK